MDWNAIHTHTHPTSLPTPALPPQSEETEGRRRLRPGPVPPRTHRGAAAASPVPRRELAEKLGGRRSGGTRAGRGRRRRRERGAGRGDKRGAQSAGEGIGRWRGAGDEWREAPDPTGLRRGKHAAGRLQRRGPLGTPSPPRICGRRGSYLTRRCGSASGESAVACAGGRAPASPAPARRPRAPLGSSRGRESPAAGARLPVALGAQRLQPGREQWSRSWCPGGGAGEGSRPPPGVSRPCGPPLRNRAAAPHASRRPGSIALRGPRRRRVPDCRTRTARPAGRPSDRRKVLGLRCFSSCGARSRPGKARSPQCAKRNLGPVGTLPPSSGHSPGSSARCGWTRVRAPARRRPLPRPPHQCPQERSERCAPARREGSLSHSHPR